MASYTAISVGGDWNNVATWGGGGYPVAGDTAIIDVTMIGTVTINVTSACAIVDCTGCTGTLVMNAGMTTTGNVTFSAGMTFTPNTQTWNMGCNGVTLTSNGKSFYNLTLQTTGTLTLADACDASNTLTIANSSTITIATSNITCGGFTEGTSSVLAGSGRTLTIDAGTWSRGTGSYVSCNVTLAGNVTLSGSIGFIAGTLTYSSGSITTTGSTLSLDTSPTLNTNGMTWNNVLVSSAGNIIVTLNSDLTMSGNLTCTETAGQAFTFAGTGNVYVGGSLLLTGATGASLKGRTITLNGTGSWNANNVQEVQSNLIINTTGTITLTQDNHYFNTGTFTYTAGTVVVTNSTVVFNGTCTVNASELTFNNVGMNYTSTITLTSNLIMSGILEVKVSGIITLATSDVQCAGLTMTGASSITGRTITMDGGTWSHTSTGVVKSNLTFAGNVTVSGTVWYNTGTLTYTSGSITVTDSTLSIVGGTTTLNTSGMTWNHVIIGASGTLNTVINLTTDLNIGGNFTSGANTNGATSFTAGKNINVAGDFTVSGAGSCGNGSGTVVLTGTGSWTRDSTGYCYINITINTAGTITLGSSMSIQGVFSSITFTYTAGTVDTSTNSSTMNFGYTQTINSAGITWYNVLFSTYSSPTYTLSSNVTISNLMTVSSTGTCTFATSNITCGGLTLNNTGSCTGRTITMTGGTWQHTSTGAVKSNLTLAGNITVSGTVYYNTGTLTYSSGTITTTGSTLNIGAATTLNTPSANMHWNNITLSATNTLTLTNSIHLDGTLRASAGTTTIATSDITCGGLTTNGSGKFTGSRTITMDGGTWQRLTPSGGDGIFCNLTLAGDITFGDVNIAGGTLTYVSGTITATLGIVIEGSCSINWPSTTQTINDLLVDMGVTITLLNDLTVKGDLYTASWIVNMTATFNGYNVYVGGDLRHDAVGAKIHSWAGTTTFIMNGTGQWLNLGIGTDTVNLKFDTTGTITLGSNNNYNTGTLTYVKGIIVNTGSTLNITNANTTLNTNGMTWNNITTDAANGKTVTLSSALQAVNIDLTGVTTHTILACGTNNVTLDGNWTNPKGTTGRTGNNTFTFTSGAHTLDGSTNFYNLTFNAGSDVTFDADDIFTVTNNWNATGTSGSHIIMDTDDGNPVDFDVTGAVQDITWVDAYDIDSAGGDAITTIDGSIDAGCVNWTLISSSVSNSIFFGCVC